MNALVQTVEFHPRFFAVLVLVALCGCQQLKTVSSFASVDAEPVQDLAEQAWVATQACSARSCTGSASTEANEDTVLSCWHPQSATSTRTAKKRG